MANRVIKKLAAKTGLTAAAGAALNIAGNLQGGVDPGMHHYEAIEAAKSFHPTNPLVGAGIGAAIGLGIGIHNRNQEIKRHNALNNKQKWSGK